MSQLGSHINFFDMPPPQVPTLDWTPSTSAPMQSQNNRLSRWNCASKAIGTFLKLTEKDTVYIFLYDSTSEQFTGTTQQLTNKIQNIRAGGGTSFHNVMQSIDILWKTFSHEEQEKTSKFLLTDGEDTGQVLFCIDNPENVCFKGFFDSVMAIGHQLSFSTLTNDLLSFLAGDKKDVLRFCETEEEVIDGIRGDCYAMATTNMKNVMLEMFVVNDEHFVAPKETTIEYLSEEEWLSKVDTDQETLADIQYQYHNGMFVLSPIETHMDFDETEPKIYIIALDKSGSMSTVVSTIKSQYKAPIELQSSRQPYIRVCMTVASFTPSTHIPIRGTVKGIWATFTTKNRDVKHGRLDSGIMHTEQVLNIAKEMLVLNDSLPIPLKKKQVQELYKEHFTFPHLLKKMPEWVQAQGIPVWNMITERYRLTLQGIGAKSFCEQSSIPLSTMLRATTSTAASSQAHEDNHVEFSDMNVCKICFANPPSILFSKCHHVGMCGECHELNIHANPVKTCPFCREEDIGHSTLHLDKGVGCLTCTRPCSYVGVCGHALFCETCKPYRKTDEYNCEICQQKVNAVPILLC